MTAVFRAIGTVAAVVAMFPGPLQLPASIIAVTANIAATLTASPPASQGQVSGYMVGANNPLPYMIGRSYNEGVEVHKVGWGGEVNDVQNPYLFFVRVLSCCGPVQSIEAIKTDFETVSFSGSFGSVQEASGYYNEYLYVDQQLGARPESDALVPKWTGTPQWGTSYKLSSFAALGFSAIWSKKAKRFAGGQLPRFGAVVEGVAAYDPRLDSTYPGGSGSQRINDESTWTYTRNPALHAATYGYGRYVNGVKVFGVDLSDVQSIDYSATVAWANVCDANGWKVDGKIEEPADKWNNLKRICEAGAGEPVLHGGVLSFSYQAVRTSLATITRDDLAGGISSRLSKGWKNRLNTMVSRYRSEAHDWNYVQAEAVSVPAWVTADGEKKEAERQWDLVTDVDQVSELALYDLYQRREQGPFSVPCKPHMRNYAPGDCLTLGADLGAGPTGAVKVIVRKRVVDPVSGVVSFDCEQESDAKHAAVLGAAGVAPSTLTSTTVEERDSVYVINQTPSYPLYDALEQYEQGRVVSLVDRSTWLYINATATTGNAPFIGSAYWLQLTPALTFVGDQTVSDVATAAVKANAAIDGSNNIATGKVITNSVQDFAISERPYSNLGSNTALSMTPVLLLDITLSADMAAEPQIFTGAIECAISSVEGSNWSLKMTVRRCDYATPTTYTTIINDRIFATYSSEGFSAGCLAPIIFRDTPDATYRRYRILVSLVDSTSVTALTNSFISSEALKK